MRERRQEVRVAGQGVRARVRLGHHLVIVDVSSRGALVEGQCRLRPGSRIEVQLESEVRREMVPAHVTRCMVAAIDEEGGVTYRAALSFTAACEWVREATTQAGYRLPAPMLPESPAPDDDGDLIPGSRATNRSAKD
jgi:PilZ domain.